MPAPSECPSSKRKAVPAPADHWSKVAKGERFIVEVDNVPTGRGSETTTVKVQLRRNWETGFTESVEPGFVFPPKGAHCTRTLPKMLHSNPLEGSHSVTLTPTRPVRADTGGTSTSDNLKHGDSKYHVAKSARSDAAIMV